jgi:hypothetical protein
MAGRMQSNNRDPAPPKGTRPADRARTVPDDRVGSSAYPLQSIRGAGCWMWPPPGYAGLSLAGYAGPRKVERPTV